MDFNSTIDLIIRELDEAREIIDDLKKFPDAPLLQIEMAKSKCRNAAEVIALLKNMKDRPAFKETEKTPLQQTTSSPVINEDKVPEEKPAPEELRIEDIPPKLKKEKKEDASEDDRQPPEKDKKPYVAPIIADTFSHLANRFNEQIGNGDDFQFTKGKQVANLSEAIGINDRFYFIMEVFNGDKEAYTQAVSKLENASTYNEARTILSGSKHERANNDAYRQMLELVKRKFTPDE